MKRYRFAQSFAMRLRVSAAREFVVFVADENLVRSEYACLLKAQRRYSRARWFASACANRYCYPCACNMAEVYRWRAMPNQGGSAYKNR